MKDRSKYWKNEQQFKRWWCEQVVEHVDSSAHYHFHEDRHQKGVPDVSMTLIWHDEVVNLWIEFKYSRRRWSDCWRHYTADQHNWMLARARAGGSCFVIAGVGDSYGVWPVQAMEPLKGAHTSLMDHLFNSDDDVFEVIRRMEDPLIEF